MSEIMLHGVLNMPPELWNNDSPIDVMQRHSRYVQASKYIDELERELAAVTEQLKAAQDGWHDEITKGLSELRRAESIYTKAQERAEKAEEQRDRLAEALKDALYDLETSDGLMACDNEEGHSLFCLEQRSIPKARQAIQSLNQAAVKGGSDE